MHSSAHSSVAAVGHYVESERLVEALPLASKRGERDYQLRLALCHALLSVAATMIETDGEGAS